MSGAAAEWTRFGAILSRLGSSHAGERAAAALLADRAAQKLGGWSAVQARLAVQGGQPSTSTWRPEPMAPSTSHGRQAASLLAQDGWLTEWETGFLISIRARRRVTTRQEETLTSIAADVRRRMKEAA